MSGIAHKYVRCRTQNRATQKPGAISSDSLPRLPRNARIWALFERVPDDGINVPRSARGGPARIAFTNIEHAFTTRGMCLEIIRRTEITVQRRNDLRRPRANCQSNSKTEALREQNLQDADFRLDPLWRCAVSRLNQLITSKNCIA